MPLKRETDYVGLNYNSPNTPEINKDVSANIRYGVIHSNEISQAWSEAAEEYYGDPSCPECGTIVIEDEDLLGYYCTECRETFDLDEILPDSPLSYDYQDDGYSMVECDDGDIFITKSPFYTYAQFCSPCAPGACHLLNPLVPSARTPNNKCYCIGHDWFDDNLAPYDIFDVNTGLQVPPQPKAAV